MSRILLLVALFGGVSLAEPAPGGPPTAASAEAVGIPGIPPGVAPPASEVHEISMAIAKGLRCPTCQGLSVGDSQADAALAMKSRIEELVALGYDGDQIRDFFIDKYGEWILLEPQAAGVNWLVWAGPVGGGLLAVAFVAVMALVGRVRGPAPAPEPRLSPAAPQEKVDALSEYRRKILEEAGK